MRKKTSAVLIILGLIIILGIFGMAEITQIHPRALPTPIFTYQLSLANSNESVGIINASQGMTERVNITFTSLINQEIVIPIENPKVAYYNSTVDLNTTIYDNGNYSAIQQQAFNFSFSQNPLILQPETSNSTILTINVNKDAPPGRYNFEFNLYNTTIIDSTGKSKLSYKQSFDDLGIIVT